MDNASITTTQRSVKSFTSSGPSYRSVASDEVELVNYDPSQQSGHPITESTTWGRSHHDVFKSSGYWARAFEDVKQATWFFGHMLPIVIILGLVALLTIMSIPGYIKNTIGSVCQPDSTFLLTSTEDYSPWKRDAIFAINMGYGSYSFGVAKLIDVVWDIAVGRGGQVILAIFTYRAFTKGIAYKMEKMAIPYETFKAVTLENDTFLGALRLMRNYHRNTGARAKIAMFWMILAALFVLFVPTWLSAMTGYSAVIAGYVRDSEGNFVPAQDFTPVLYVIHDGHRLGSAYTDEYHVVVPWYYDELRLMYDEYDCALPLSYNSSTGNYTWDYTNKAFDCGTMWRVSQYTSQYGFLAQVQDNTTFIFPDGNQTILSPPSLNISAHFTQDTYNFTLQYFANLEWSSIPFGRSWEDPTTKSHPYWEKYDPMLYNAKTQTAYSLGEFNENGSCLQELNVSYKWGFSFMLLFIFVVTLLIWSIGMYGFYLHSYLHSRVDRLKRHMGTERAVMDMSVVIQKKLDAEQFELYDNSQLEKLLDGETITYTDLPLDKLLPTRWMALRQRWKGYESSRPISTWWKNFKFRPWAKAEKWWLLALLIFTILFALSWSPVKYIFVFWTPYASVLPGFGVFVVLCMGRKVKARWLVFATFFAVFLGVDIWWMVRIRRYLRYYLS